MRQGSPPSNKLSRGTATQGVKGSFRRAQQLISRLNIHSTNSHRKRLQSHCEPKRPDLCFLSFPSFLPSFQLLYLGKEVSGVRKVSGLHTRAQHIPDPTLDLSFTPCCCLISYLRPESMRLEQKAKCVNSVGPCPKFPFLEG